MRLVLAGGSGFLGTHFARFARDRGHTCTVLTRSPRDAHDMYWDGRTRGAWTAQVEAADAVVNFTGKSVQCLYTAANREEILQSRLDSVRVLTETIAACAYPPRAFVQCASLRIFGDTQAWCDEDSPPGEGFSEDVCEQWEREFFRVTLPRTRQCLLRIGFVLGPDGGAMVPLRRLARSFLGGTVGPGDQYISWLHVEDFNRIVLACIDDARFEGVYNTTSPHPVTNREFMATLRRVLHRPWSPPVPAPLVRFGAQCLMRTDSSLALTGRRCRPKRLQEAAFRFDHVGLEESLWDVCRDRQKR